MMTAKSFQLTTKQTIYGFSISLLLCILLSIFLPKLESEQNHIKNFEKKLHQKEVAIEKLLLNFAKEIEVSNYDDLFKKQLISYKSLYNTDGFVLLVYENDSLKFWSDNHIPVENFLLKICLDSKIVKLNNGLFEVRRKELNNKVIIGLILIKNDYSFNNEYLKDEYATGFNLPANTSISEIKGNSINDVFSKEKHYLFTLNKVEHEAHLWIEYIQIICFLSCLFFLVLLIELSCFRFFHQYGFYTYYLSFGFLLSIMRIGLLKLGFPEALYNTELFSPSIYAHTAYIPSLGDLLLHAALLAAYFYGLYVHIKSNLNSEKQNYKVLIGLNVAFALLTVLSINVIISLVNDSKINVNVNNLISLNAYSYLGYISIGLLLTSLYYAGQVLIMQQKKYHIKVVSGFFALALVLCATFLLLNVSLQYVLIPLAWFALQEVLEYNTFTSNYTTKSIFYLTLASAFTTIIIRNEISLSNEQKLKFLLPIPLVFQ